MFKINSSATYFVFSILGVVAMTACAPEGAVDYPDVLVSGDSLAVDSAEAAVAGVDAEQASPGGIVVDESEWDDDPDYRSISTNYSGSGWPARTVYARADQFRGTPCVHFTYKRYGVTCTTSGTAMSFVPNTQITQTMCGSLSGTSWTGSYCRSTSTGGRADAYKATFTSIVSTQLNYNVVDLVSGSVRDSSGWVGNNGCPRPSL